MLVYICSKLRGNVEENQNKVKKYCKQVVDEGNIPIAPHIYFTQFMDDNKEEDRNKAFAMNKELLDLCDCLNVYGSELSEGMQLEVNYALSKNKNIRYFDSL